MYVQKKRDARTLLFCSKTNCALTFSLPSPSLLKLSNDCCENLVFYTGFPTTGLM